MKITIKNLVKPPVNQSEPCTIEELLIEAEDCDTATDVLSVLREILENR